MPLVGACAHSVYTLLMLVLAKRKNEDSRSLGRLFYMMADELRDKTFHESTQLFVCMMFASNADAFTFRRRKC